MQPEASALPSPSNFQMPHAYIISRHHASEWARGHSLRLYASNAGNNKSQAASPAEEQAQPAEEQAEEAVELSNEQLMLDRSQLASQVEKLTDQLKRTLADMENLRKRTERDVDSAKKFAVQGFVKNILDVADNLERAAGAVPASALNEDPEEGAQDAAQLRKLLKSLLEGVSATERVLLNVFKQNGVEQYNPVGEKFDPNLHNALYQVPDPSKEAGTVAAVSKRGYKLHGRVIRPADVGVARAP